MAITATGITGVMALWVNQRTREIGIRLALGARPARRAPRIDPIVALRAE